MANHAPGVAISPYNDGQFQITSNNRDWNQEKNETNLWKIKNYLNSNGLQVNEDKMAVTEYMTYQKRTRQRGIPPDITVRESTTDRRGRVTEQDKLITDSGSCRMLGLTIKNNMSWVEHMNTGKKALLPALRKQLGYISRNSMNMSKKAKLKLVNGLVLSRLTYAICIWGNTNDTLILKTQRILNTAARMISVLPKYTRQSDLIVGIIQ